MRRAGRLLVDGLIAVALCAAVYALGYLDGRDHATVGQGIGPLPRCLTVYDRYRSYERIHPRRMPHVRRAGVAG